MVKNWQVCGFPQKNGEIGGFWHIRRMKWGCHFLVCMVLLFSGCGRQDESNGRRTFVVNGVVKQLEPDGKTVVIQHEAIPNYMAAMTMPFEARNPRELAGLSAGEAVTFHLVVTSNAGWIEDIAPRRERAVAVASLSTNRPPGFEITRAVEPLAEGDPLPNYHFTNQLGQAMDFSEFKGQPFAFTFFFTSCPFPNFCPRLTSNFEQVSADLMKMTNAPAQWHLFSISFDTKVDAPPRLLAYAEGAHYDPAHWSFLTGSPEEIAELADQVGETYSIQPGNITHNLRTVVVDGRGRIQKIFQGNYWTPDELTRAIEAASR